MSKSFLTIFLFALVLRIVPIFFLASFESQIFLEPDSYDYLDLARNLVDHGFFGKNGDPEVFRVPGYPLYIAAFLACGLPVGAAIVLQAILDALTCVLVGQLACRLCNKTSGLIAGIIQAVSLVSIVYASRLLSETLFTFVFCVWLLLFERCLRRPETLPGWLCGLSLGILGGILAYLRAVALPMMGLLCLAFAVASLPFPWKGSFRSRILQIDRRAMAAAWVAALVFTCALVPWIIRNTVVAGAPVFSTVSSINLYRYNACLLYADSEGIGFGDAQSRISAELSAAGDQAEAGRLAQQRGIKIILGKPLRYAYLHLKTVPLNFAPAGGELLRTFGITVGGSGTLAIIHSDGLIKGISHYLNGNWWTLALIIPETIGLLLLYAAAGIGACFLIFRTDRQTAIFAVALLLLLGYLLFVPGGAAHPRFRVPASPILAVLAAAALVRIRKAQIHDNLP
jgi:hypothetical protein